jgi:SAM-dependent methyltransferase
MGRIDNGILIKPRLYYAAYLLLAVFLALRFEAGIVAILFLFLIDWIDFRFRRGGALARYDTNPLKLVTVADHQAVDSVYEREGTPQPTMSDWVDLAREAAGTGLGDAEDSVQEDSIQEDGRYLDIKRVYDRAPQTAGVTIDVGANDGRATWRFGVGDDGTVLGVDVSHLLLRDFLKNLPDHVALQADGACLPLKDACADFVLCTETLEHIPDPGAAVAEFFRVLKPGGRLMVQSPNAHRLRNLNPIHILVLFVSLATDVVLQKKRVHENTWHNAITYHWDFSLQDYYRMVKAAGGTMLELRSAQFFFPRFLLRGRRSRFSAKERTLAAIPILRYFGGDLVMVAEKRSHPK